MQNNKNNSNGLTPFELNELEDDFSIFMEKLEIERSKEMNEVIAKAEEKQVEDIRQSIKIY
jgi:hypothetical protein